MQGKARHLYVTGGALAAMLLPGMAEETRGIIVSTLVGISILTEGLVEGIRHYGVRGEIRRIGERLMEIEGEKK